MVRSIQMLLEDYFSNTDLMNMLLKNHEKELKQATKKQEQRQLFLISILGKVTYNKYMNKGIFAPIPLSALHIKFNDLYYMFIENNVKQQPMSNEAGIERVKKLIAYINKTYTRNEFKLIDNGVDFNVYTNLIFKQLDDIIDFLLTLQKGVLKISKIKDPNKISWKTIIKKFRDYLK